ncbi:MAG: 2-keto-4-pentenoate hydratase [Ponticaulis sp.]|nr:2-keto-4-pentenoate hydratase [Ponticaulis sp.]
MKIADQRAEGFVSARLGSGLVSTYPGELPQTLDEAYGIQDEAIRAWPDAVKGWKVGRITGDYEQQYGCDRLVGPVFEPFCHDASADSIDMPAFAKGFTAVEGEVTAVIAKDFPADKTTVTSEEALDYIESLHLGVEVASSPFPGINDFGPLVTISDFGNNRGLILGAEIPGWKEMRLEDWQFVTEINDDEVGRATPEGLPGGPVESVRYLLENTARRGLPLKKGMMVLTGAVTGVHEAKIGDSSTISLLGNSISLQLTEA